MNHSFHHSLTERLTNVTLYRHRKHLVCYASEGLSDFGALMWEFIQEKKERKHAFEQVKKRKNKIQENKRSTKKKRNFLDLPFFLS